MPFSVMNLETGVILPRAIPVMSLTRHSTSVMRRSFSQLARSLMGSSSRPCQAFYSLHRKLKTVMQLVKGGRQHQQGRKQVFPPRETTMGHGGKKIKTLALSGNAFSHHPPPQSRQAHAVTGVALCVI